MGDTTNLCLRVEGPVIFVVWPSIIIVRWGPLNLCLRVGGPVIFVVWPWIIMVRWGPLNFVVWWVSGWSLSQDGWAGWQLVTSSVWETVLSVTFRCPLWPMLLLMCLEQRLLPSCPRPTALTKAFPPKVGYNCSYGPLCLWKQGQLALMLHPFLNYRLQWVAVGQH